MNYLAQNIKYLRETTLQDSKKLSQQGLADQLGIKRSTLNDYESGKTEPNYATLLRLAEHFQLSLEQLLRTNLATATQQPVLDLEGKYLRVIATTLGPDGEDNVELVPITAAAGYTRGYGDPEYVNSLPRFRLPFLASGRKYRIFPIKGDSMPPVQPGDWVVGEFVTNFHELKDGEPCIVLTQEDGLVFKQVFSRLKTHNSLLLRSTNPLYHDYEVAADQVREVWRFAGSYTLRFKMPHFNAEELLGIVYQQQEQLRQLEHRLHLQPVGQGK